MGGLGWICILIWIYCHADNSKSLVHEYKLFFHLFRPTLISFNNVFLLTNLQIFYVFC